MRASKVNIINNKIQVSVRAHTPATHALVWIVICVCAVCVRCAIICCEKVVKDTQSAARNTAAKRVKPASAPGSSIMTAKIVW